MPSSSPPKFSFKLIEWLCKPELAEELKGNLEEYYALVKSNSFGYLKYWYQVLAYLRLSTLKSLKTQKSGPMFVFNPVLTFRNLYRHKSTSLISVSGFTLGLVAAFFLYFYIQNELTNDSFHADKDKIYRAIRVSGINGSPYTIGVTSGPFAMALKNDFPSAVKSATRAYPQDGLVSFEDKKFQEDRLLFADANFFDFFSFPLASGDPSSVLSDANSVVISEETAIKYFGEDDPIGKILKIDNEYPFIVSGIMQEWPANSHMEFDMVLSISFFERFQWFSDWWNNGLMTYVKIDNPEIAQNVKSQLPAFMDKYFGDDFAESGNRVDLDLEPLGDIYFNRETRYDFARHGNINSIYILALVAIAILFIACFNYVNLSIGQSFMRAKEVGVRKVMGVRRTRLVLQFIGESWVILSISILIAIGISELINPLFNSFFGLQVELEWLQLSVFNFLLILFGVVLITSGLYPALLLSSFKPIQAMKGSKATSGKKGLRKGLVIAQFSISIFLIVATLFISAQTKFLNSLDLGFNKEAVVTIDLNSPEIRRKRADFVERLMTNSNILEVTQLSGEPGGFHDASSFDISGLDDNYRMRTVFTDTKYFNVFDIEIVAGRNFSDEISSDVENTIILNEKAVSEIGLSAEEIIGRRTTMPSWNLPEATIIGVAKDFYFLSLKDDIEPLAIRTSQSNHRRLAVKLSNQNVKESLLFIDEVFKEFAPDYPLSYDFLDDSLARLYEDEEKQARIFSAFSGVSIFLACLGILGLATYSARQRQKELGIRKVLGATPSQILGLISKEFVLLVLVAVLIAAPSAWYFMESWLSDFANRIDILSHWYIFVIGGISAVAIALLTVSLKTYNAAISDPTDSIRNE